ncbi:MAG: DUF262 domain-containing HNH endonuclease family protein [Propionicimonas sp.]|uniref:DUF262 domain-containing protein n=1 Tax=Propionicimonas sp. TaxID=1955623 RepID=UPI003D149A58
MKQLDAGEYPLRKIFSSDFQFWIPDYQRPYAWGVEQALQLLDDLEGALDRDTDEPYFLGSIVLVKESGAVKADVIDGQQRLTTLSILFAVLRDVTGNPALSTELGNLLVEPGQILAGTTAEQRLRLRKRDSQFFRDHVQTAGRLGALIALTDAALETDAQKAIRDNAKALHERIQSWPDAKLQTFAAMVGTRTFLVVVSTPDLNSAHRIFSVMNARGLDLSPSDIFKAQVIGAIGSDEQSATYADKWEQEEQDLGRDGFAELFGHVRMIFAKERGRRELLIEFPQQVLNGYLPERAKEFVDEVLIPYSDAYEHLITQNYPHDATWSPVNAWLARLMQVDNSDWRPAALWALRHHADEPAFLAAFLERLERLAASMLIRRVYATPRATRYAELLRELERGLGLDAPSFGLSAEERLETRRRLEGEIYLVAPVRKYVLLRLDERLANQPGVSYQHKLITVEHVLPQTPKTDSAWAREFSEDERTSWTHRLANLVLLNRAKNSEAQRFDFGEKKTRYFTGPNGVAVFALTKGVLQEFEWTPQVLERRQRKLLDLLGSMWGLN